MWLFTFVSLLASAASDRSAAVQGFAEVRAQAYTGVDGVPVFVVERFRPTFDAPLGERLALSMTVEAALTQGRRTQDELRRTLEESDLGPMLDAAKCTWPEEENPFLGVSEAEDYVWVDRLYMDAYLPGVDVRVGRQALNWGSAFMVNPTDPFPQVLLLEPWRPRAGVNAIRASIPVLSDHRIQLVAGTDDAFRQPRMAARATFNRWETDWSVIGAWRPESDETLVGGDIKGTLGVGFWAEGAWHIRDDAYGEVAAGFDYSFPVLQGLVLTAQYYKSGRTTAASSGLSGIASTAAVPDCASGDAAALFGDGATTVDPFAPFFGGQNYLMASAGLSINPVLSLSSLLVQNWDDGTGLVFPTLSVAPRGWLEMSVAAQVPIRTFGDGGELSPSADDLVLSQSVVPGAPPLTVDFTGLVPTSTIVFWTRASF